MTDIDFDELDKAVTNLMGSVGKERVDDMPEEKTFNINTTLKPGEKPPYDKLGEAAKSIGNETLTTISEQTLVADDEKTAALAEPAQTPEPVTTMPVVASTPVAAAASRTALVQPAPRPSNGRFMDVVHPSSDMKTASPAPVTPAAPAPVVSEAPLTPAPVPEKIPEPTPAEPIPLTPFLPDAKVEKRPLGGGAPTTGEDTKDEPISTAETVFTEEKAETKRNVDEPAEIANIPEEASASIRSIESIDTEKLINQAAEQKNETTQPDEAKPGGIYDVKNYHQPLGHPEKQKSGWGIVVIILLVIVLAAGLGAAAYFILGLGV